MPEDCGRKRFSLKVNQKRGRAVNWTTFARSILSEEKPAHGAESKKKARSLGRVDPKSRGSGRPKRKEEEERQEGSQGGVRNLSDLLGAGEARSGNGEKGKDNG